MRILLLGFTELGKLFDNRFPIITCPFQLSGSGNRMVCSYCNCIFLCSGNRSRSFLLRRSLNRLLCFSAKREFNGSRRQAVLVVASTVFQITFHYIVATRKPYLLGKPGISFKITHLHREDWIHIFHFSCTGSKFADQLGSLNLIYIKCSGSRSSVFQSCRIHVPSGINRTRKHNFGFGSRKFFPFGFELYRILHLCKHRQAEQSHQQPTECRSCFHCFVFYLLIIKIFLFLSMSPNLIR